MRSCFVASIVLTLAACAAPAPAPIAVASAAPAESTDRAAPKMECHQESSIGSMVMHKVCTKEPTESERNALQESLRQVPLSNAVAHPAPEPKRQ